MYITGEHKMKNTITNKKELKMKTYKLICKTFGHKFSFNASDFETATQMKNEWCHYHSFLLNDFTVEETTDTKWIHNEYFS